MMLKNPNKYPQVTVRVTGDTLNYVLPDREGHYGASGREFIEFATEALRQATSAELDGKFTADELVAIIDAMNGTHWDAMTLRYMHSEILEATEDDSLAQRVKGLSFTARWALLLATRRYWAAHREGTADVHSIGIATASD